MNVNFKVIPWSDLFNNITTATTSGKGPDVLNIGNTWSASLQATGAFLPFDGGTLRRSAARTSSCRPRSRPAARPGRTRPRSRSTGSSYALFYNKKLFKQAGLQPPKTWSEFVADAEEADQGHQRRRQARPVGLRHGGRLDHRERPLRLHPRPPAQAASCSTATSRSSTRPERQGRQGLRGPDRRDKVAEPSDATVRRRPARRRPVRQGQDRDAHLPEQHGEQPQGRRHARATAWRTSRCSTGRATRS